MEEQTQAVQSEAVEVAAAVETPAPVEPVEAKPEAVEEPAPVQAEETPQAMKVEEEAPKDPGKDLEFFIKRIGELETEKKELNGLLASMKEAEEERKVEEIRREVERKEKARADLLSNDWKILKPEYMALAPSVEFADPTTDAGRESLRQWVNANPGLFGKAPELPKGEQTSESPGVFGGVKGWKWADKWK